MSVHAWKRFSLPYVYDHPAWFWDDSSSPSSLDGWSRLWLHWTRPPNLFPQYTPAPLPQGNQAFQNQGQGHFDAKIPFAYGAANARKPLRENKVFPLPCKVILDRLLAGGKITLPEQRPQDLTKVNMSKFCSYHRAYGHETNSCWNL